MSLVIISNAGGGGGVVDSVTAGDLSIVVGGTAANPTVETGTLDEIATLHPPAGNWSNNSKKITALANGSGAQDAAAFGQIGTAVAMETARAEAAEALLVPLSDLPLSVANGGTGQTAQQAAMDALAGAQTAGQFLRGNGIHVQLAAIQMADLAPASPAPSPYAPLLYGAIWGYPWRFDIMNTAYAGGAKGNGKPIYDVVITNGSPALSSASAGFTSAVTGMSILIAGGAGGGAALVATMTYVSSTQVTLSVNAGATFTSGSPTAAIYGSADTAAINAARAAAFTYMAATGNQAEITGPPFIYCLPDATTKTASGGLHFNSQIPLIPCVGPGANKLVPAFRFGAGGVAAPIFSQSVPQAAGGATFVSMLTGLTVDGTYGVPSVIGGPTDGTESGTASTWNNIVPVIEGLTIITPLNPTMMGLDFRGCAGMRIPAYTCLPFDIIANIANTKPTSSWATGLDGPVELNNDKVFIGDVQIYGMYYGVGIYAHASFQTIKVINCGYGVFCGGNGNDKHGLAGNMISAEECGTALQCDGSSGITIPVNIGMLDVESVNWFSGFGGNHVQDPNNGLGGQIRLNDNSGGASVFSINGAANCQILAANQPRAVQSAPSYTLGTPFQNPWWQHMWVTLGGGTVTGISIGPTSGSLTSLGITSGSFRLPTGWWINIAGSVKPTTFIAVPD